MVDITTSKSTIDDLVGAVGNQTKQDDRQRTRESRARQKGEDNLFNWQKKESRKQSDAEKKNAKLQGIESHMGKINQMHNYRASKSLKSKAGKGIADITGALKEKFLNFQELFGGFIERSTKGVRDTLKKAKASTLQNLQQHADMTNIWGAMKTDSSIILGMVGAIGQIPGFQTFFTVVKVILSNLAIWTFQLVKFLTSGLWKLIGKAIKWVVKKLRTMLPGKGGPVPYTDESLAAWLEGQEKKPGEKAGAGAGMFDWAGPLGTDKDPFYIMPSSMFGKQIPGKGPKDPGGTEDKEEEKDKKETKKKGFFARMYERMARKIRGFIDTITKPIRDMARMFRNLWKKILLPVFTYLKKAVVFLAKGLAKLAKFIIVTLTPLIMKLLKTLFLFVATTMFMIAQLAVTIIAGIVKLTIQMVALGVAIVMQIASTIIWVAMLIAANIKIIAMAALIGLGLYILWISFKYLEAKFSEAKDRIVLLGDKLKLLFSTWADAIYVTIRALLWGVVVMMKKLIKSMRIGIIPVGDLIWSGMPLSIRKGVNDFERDFSIVPEDLQGKYDRLEQREKEITAGASGISWVELFKSFGQSGGYNQPASANIATNIINTGAKNVYVGNNKTPNPLVWDLNTNTLK